MMQDNGKHEFIGSELTGSSHTKKKGFLQDIQADTGDGR
jgi:hypothetical protein